MGTVFGLRPWVFLVVLAPLAFADETLDLPKLAEMVRPSVMLVIAESGLTTPEKDYGPFADLVPEAHRTVATGSGFFISSDGKFVTNHHVIDNAMKIVLKSENGAFYEVQGVLADDSVADIAILKVSAKKIQFLEISSQTVQVGQRIAVIGSPMGLEGTLSEGIISAKRDLGEKGQWLQITAGISPGSSGSPVLDASGKVIGIATMLLREGQSLNFAVPAERIMATLASISAGGKIRPVTDVSADFKNDPDVQNWAKQWSKSDYAAAVKVARQLVGRYPDHPDSHWFLAIALDMLELKDEAFEAAQRSLKLKPDHYGSLILSAKILRSKGKREAGLKYATRALSIQPDNADGWFTYGQLEMLPFTWSRWLPLAPDPRPSNEGIFKSIEAFQRVISMEKQTRKEFSRLARSAWLHIAYVQAAIDHFDDAIAAQKHATEVYQEDGTSRLIWEQLKSYYNHALLLYDDREDSIRKDALQQMKRLELQSPELATQLQEYHLHSHAELVKIRATRKRVQEFNKLYPPVVHPQ